MGENPDKGGLDAYEDVQEEGIPGPAEELLRYPRDC